MFKKSIPAGLYYLSIYLEYLFSYSRDDDASSYPIGVILLVAITFLLALLILLMIQIPSFRVNMEKEIPVIFAITSVENIDELTGTMNFDSRVLLRHTGTEEYQNKNLKAKFFRNEPAGNLHCCNTEWTRFHQHLSHGHPVDGRVRMFRNNLESRRTDLYRFFGWHLSSR